MGTGHKISFPIALIETDIIYHSHLRHNIQNKPQRYNAIQRFLTLRSSSCRTFFFFFLGHLKGSVTDKNSKGIFLLYRMVISVNSKLMVNGFTGFGRYG